VRSYFTFALLLDVIVTESTLDDTAAASGLDAKALIAVANCEPFCSSCTRLLFGVEELKNAAQLVLIAAIAAAEPPLDDEPAAGVPVAADAVVAGAEVAAELLLELELLLEQAVIAAARARPSAGARKIRRPVLRSGICCASLGRRRIMPTTGQAIFD
jgi:hypothetical protein